MTKTISFSWWYEPQKDPYPWYAKEPFLRGLRWGRVPCTNWVWEVYVR